MTNLTTSIHPGQPIKPMTFLILRVGSKWPIVSQESPINKREQNGKAVLDIMHDSYDILLPELVAQGTCVGSEKMWEYDPDILQSCAFKH